MSRWSGRPSALTPEIVALVQQVHQLREALPTWEQLERATGINANTLRGAARGRVPKRVLRRGDEISS